MEKNSENVELKLHPKDGANLKVKGIKKIASCL